MLTWVLLVVLTETGAEEFKKGVVPVSAEGQLVAGGHDQCYICVSVTFEMKSRYWPLLEHTTVISPSASSDRILDLKLGKLGVHAPNLVCVTSPWSQFAGEKEGWKKVTQCYHMGKCRHSSMRVPESLTISPTAEFDVYQAQGTRQGFLQLWMDNVHIVGRKKLRLREARNATFPRLGPHPCRSRPQGVCLHGCMAVCPARGKNPETFCLSKPRADVHRHWSEETVVREDRLVLNRRSGTVSFLPSNRPVVAFASPGDRFVSCAPLGVSGHCEVLSGKGVCLTRKHTCDVSSVPPQVPIFSTFVSHYHRGQFSGRHVQPLPDPLPYCMVTSRLERASSVATCVRALLAVPKASAFYRNQLETANHSGREELVLGSASSHVFHVLEKSFRGLGTPHVGPFVLAQICVLTSIMVHFLLDSDRRNGRR